MQVIVDDKSYKVRHNYLHRGQNPRLILEHKEAGTLVYIQLDTKEIVYNLPMRGYWCVGDSFKPIDVTLIN